MSEFAQEVSPGTALFLLALLVGISIISLTAGWYALLNPRSRWSSYTGRLPNLKFSTRVLQTMKVIGALVVMGSFASLMVYLREVTKYAVGAEVATGSYNITFVAANGIIFVFVVPIGWALLVIWDIVKGMWKRLRRDHVTCM